MNSAPHIAVLMPSYNPGREIERTLASLREQQTPFRLFVIDDGSSRKPDYARLLADFDHHLIVSPRNLGVNEARNPALGAILDAGHEYIALIDCGDEMLSGRLATQAAFLEANPGIAIVGSQVELFVEQNASRALTSYPEEHEGIMRELWVNLPLSHPSLMLRSDVFRRIGLYSSRYEAAEDYDLCWRARDAGFRFHNIPQLLLRKIETTDSISWRKRRIQLRSRARIQWAHRDLANPHCLKGLAKTALVRALPDRAALVVKKLLAGRRAPA